ncbi:MAG: D-lyxose/D-mannose family sugar isomerase [Opitutales bacterium]
MKRSEINALFHEASAVFERHGWALPPNARWDITDFGLGTFDRFGLALVNLAEEPEYCEKVMYARPGQQTPAHCHRRKKEDIICRHGKLALQVWAERPGSGATDGQPLTLPINGVPRDLPAGETLVLKAGERITLVPGVWHTFWPDSPDCIIGEVSTANDDRNDNVFASDDIGRFPFITEDAPPAVRLVSETKG